MNLAVICGLIAATLIIASPALAQEPSANVSASADLSSGPEVDVSVAVSGLYAAFRAGKWLVALGFGLMIAGAFLRSLVSLKWGDFADSKLGGKLLGAGSAFAVAFGVALSAGMGVVASFLAALGLMATASGIKSLLPNLKK